MIGILPFLVQWLTLSGFGGNQQHLQQYGSIPPKSHWALLSEFQQLPEDEIEAFLPQVCNILVDRDQKDEYGVYDQFERILVEKCAGCLTFGMRVCGLLKAASPGPSEGLFKNVLANNAGQVAREERLRNLHEHCEAATLHGNNLPDRMNHLRSTYFRDVNFMLDTLSRLGTELKAYPHAQRNHHLQNAVSNLNNWLYNRMLGKGQVDVNPDNVVSADFHSGVTPQMVAQNCPLAAAYSVHLPLQHCSDKVQRVLRFVENECEVLPSKERTPYLLVAEMIEQPFTCKSEELFAQGHPLGLSIEDVINGRSLRNYRLFLQPPQLHHQHPATITTGPGPSLAATDAIDIDSILNSGLDAFVSTTLPSEPRPVRPECVAAPMEERADLCDPPSESDFDTLAEAEAETENVRTFAREDMPLAPGAGAGMWANELDLRGGHLPPEGGADMYGQPYGQPQAAQYLSQQQQQQCQQQQQPQYQYQQPTPMQYGGSGGAPSPWDGSAVPPPAGYPQGGGGMYGPGGDQYPDQNAPNGYGSGPYPVEGSGYMGNGYGNGNGNGMDPHVPGMPGMGMGMGMRKTFMKGKTWEEKKALIQSASAFGHLPGWTVKSFIVKAGDDLRKEILAMQVINLCQQIFQSEGIDVALRPYQIVSTGLQSGLVEFVEGARSVDRIKKSSPDVPSLKEFFDFSYGASYSIAHSKAVQNFVKSLAGYSLITYLLQVRDRHNANILLDSDGHVIHIDYGFIFGDSPGFNMNFENAPFKLTREYLEVMGGVESQAFKMFEDLFVRGFFALQKHSDALAAIVQLFYGDRRKQAADGLRSRLMFATSQADVLSLVRDSFDNWRTKQYDWFQQRSNNILM